MYTHFLSLPTGRGFPGAQEMKFIIEPSAHLWSHRTQVQSPPSTALEAQTGLKEHTAQCTQRPQAYRLQEKPFPACPQLSQMPENPTAGKRPDLHRLLVFCFGALMHVRQGLTVVPWKPAFALSVCWPVCSRCDTGMMGKCHHHVAPGTCWTL